MLDRLKVLAERYEKLSELLSDPDVVSDPARLRSYAKEQAELEEIYRAYQEYKSVVTQLEDAKALLNEKIDDELREMAKAEVAELSERKEKLEERIRILLLPKDPNDGKNVIMEIRGAAGGEEANLFAADLYRMYVRYAESQGWRVEVLDSHVLVMPEAEEVEVEILDKDIRVDTFCASGPGGQSVNTTKSAVRVTHIPTGIVVTCQDGKSQNDNKAKALQVLRARILEKKRREEEERQAGERKEKIGTGDRSERIRTYNFPQSRVTDHRIGLTLHRLDSVLAGEIDEIINALILAEQTEMLKKETPA